MTKMSSLLHTPNSSSTLPFVADFGKSVNSDGRTWSNRTSGANSPTFDSLITAISEFAKWIFCVELITSIFSKIPKKNPEVTVAIHNQGFNLHPTGWANIP